MPSITDIRAAARRRLHGAFQRPVTYTSPVSGDPVVEATARLTDIVGYQGDLVSRDWGAAERIESTPEVVVLADDMVPKRGGVFCFSATEAWRVENVMPPHGVTITAQVSQLSEAEAAGYPAPTV